MACIRNTVQPLHCTNASVPVSVQISEHVKLYEVLFNKFNRTCIHYPYAICSWSQSTWTELSVLMFCALDNRVTILRNKVVEITAPKRKVAWVYCFIDAVTKHINYSNRIKSLLYDFTSMWLHNGLSLFVIVLIATAPDVKKVKMFVEGAIEPVYKLWPMDKTASQLNESQLYSMSFAMENKLQLIQGPPGLLKQCYIIISIFCVCQLEKMVWYT